MKGKFFTAPFLRVNDTRIDLCAKSLQEGQLRLDEGAEAEQCAGCGENILWTGELSEDQRRVRCECSETYEIIEHQRN